MSSASLEASADAGSEYITNRYIALHKAVLQIDAAGRGFVYASTQKARLIAMSNAIYAIGELVKRVSPEVQNETAALFAQFEISFDALINGETPEQFEPAQPKAGSRKKKNLSYNELQRRATAKFCYEILCSKGFKSEDAAKITWQLAQECGIMLRGSVKNSLVANFTNSRQAVRLYMALRKSYRHQVEANVKSPLDALECCYEFLSGEMLFRKATAANVDRSLAIARLYPPEEPTSDFAVALGEEACASLHKMRDAAAKEREDLRAHLKKCQPTYLKQWLLARRSRLRQRRHNHRANPSS